MSGKKRWRIFWLCRGGLAVFLVVCLVALAFYLNTAYREKSNLSELNFEYMDTVEQQAWQMAENVVGGSRDVQEQFVNEVMALYYKVKGSDIAIFCSPGGWGKKPMSADYQGESWLVGMGTELTELGYKYCVIDDIRTGNGLGAYLFELREQLTHYPSKAKELAAKIDFLTQQVAGLKIIITGQSNGAGFANEVARDLDGNLGVYSIQVGCPFWYRTSKVGQSLVIDNNGLGADALTQRDIATLFKANWLKFFVIGQAPSFTPIDWFITKVVLLFASYDFNLGLGAPGHEYMWEYPGVGPVIEAFLVRNFGT
jgi:hypothetical protein